jgi:predicted Fe-Mo cluster-binding NifX family protein
VDLKNDNSNHFKGLRRSMKIAAITEDGTTVSQHFGRAPYYLVLTVEDGKIVGKERRDKSGHHTFATHEEKHLAPRERHGYDAASQTKHAGMAATIADCQVLLVGGMGQGAYDSLKNGGIDVIVTDVNDIEEAVRRYLGGNLPNLEGRLH